MESLQNMGHEIMVPNSYDAPMKENEMKILGSDEHRIWKSGMIKLQRDKVSQNDAILVLNFGKKVNETIMTNYIGGATFLEIYEAFMQGKKIFFYNPLPENIFTDELKAFGAIIINGDLTKIT